MIWLSLATCKLATCKLATCKLATCNVNTSSCQKQHLLTMHRACCPPYVTTCCYLYLKSACTLTAQHVALGTWICGFQSHSEVVEVVGAFVLPQYGSKPSCCCFIEDKARGRGLVSVLDRAQGIPRGRIMMRSPLKSRCGVIPRGMAIGRDVLRDSSTSNGRASRCALS